MVGVGWLDGFPEAQPGGDTCPYRRLWSIMVHVGGGLPAQEDRSRTSQGNWYFCWYPPVSKDTLNETSHLDCCSTRSSTGGTVGLLHVDYLPTCQDGGMMGGNKQQDTCGYHFLS